MSGQPPLPATPIELPLLPLRDVVVFPHMVIPLFVGRPKSIKALEAAMAAERRIMLVAQKAAAKDEPSVTDMFEVGCVSTILQMLKLPDGTVKVLVEGQQRAKVDGIEDGESHFTAHVTPIEVLPAEAGSEVEALRRAVMQQFDQYVKLNKKIPPEILTSISSIDDAGRLADTIAAHLPLKLESKQVVLDLSPVRERLSNLFEQIEREVEILNVDKKIRGRVKRQMEKNQRDFYLNEQVKAIQKELGEGEEGADIEEIEKKIKAARMPQEARKKAESELKKLALDIVEGKVFGSWMVPEHDDSLLTCIFMPLAFGAGASLSDNNAVCIYEYYSKSGNRSVNGYPTFMSFHYITAAELDILRPLIEKAAAMRKEFLGEDHGIELQPDNGHNQDVRDPGSAD